MKTINNKETEIAINTIKSIGGDMHFTKSTDIKKYNIEEMSPSQLHVTAKSLIKKVADVDNIEIEEKLIDFYLRSVCEEIYGEEDTSDIEEQKVGYLATAIWNDRIAIGKRLLELLSEESHVNYYQTAINHYDMSEEINDGFKSVITSVMDRYDR